MRLWRADTANLFRWSLASGPLPRRDRGMGGFASDRTDEASSWRDRRSVGRRARDNGMITAAAEPYG